MVMKLREMYEFYLSTQLKANFVCSKGDKHCWQVSEERVINRHIYDWIGKPLDTVSFSITLPRYIWLGSKGSISITRSPENPTKNNVQSSIPDTMRCWVWKEFFNIKMKEC